MCFIKNVFHALKGGHGNPLQYSCLENPKDRGARQATVHGVAKSQTQLKYLPTHTHTQYVHRWSSKGEINTNGSKDIGATT